MESVTPLLLFFRSRKKKTRKKTLSTLADPLQARRQKARPAAQEDCEEDAIAQVEWEREREREMFGGVLVREREREREKLYKTKKND